MDCVLSRVHVVNTPTFNCVRTAVNENNGFWRTITLQSEVFLNVVVYNITDSEQKLMLQKPSS